MSAQTLLKGVSRKTRYALYKEGRTIRYVNIAVNGSRCTSGCIDDRAAHSPMYLGL